MPSQDFANLSFVTTFLMEVVDVADGEVNKLGAFQGSGSLLTKNTEGPQNRLAFSSQSNNMLKGMHVSLRFIASWTSLHLKFSQAWRSL